MFEKLSTNSKKVLRLSHSTARALGHSSVGAEHILLALFESMDETMTNEFAALGISYDALKKTIVKRHPKESAFIQASDTSLGPEAHIIFARSEVERKRHSDEETEPKHIFQALEWLGNSDKGNCLAWEALMDLSSDHDAKKSLKKFGLNVSRTKKERVMERYKKPNTFEPVLPKAAAPVSPPQFAKHPLLKTFSEITIQAIEKAFEEAENYDKDKTGDEFLINGLCKSGKGLPAFIFSRSRMQPKEVESRLVKVQNIFRRDCSFDYYFTPRARKSLTEARKEANAVHSKTVEPIHLLLAIEKNNNPVFRHFLESNIEKGSIRKSLQEGLKVSKATYERQKIYDSITHSLNIPKEFSFISERGSRHAFVEARNLGSPTVTLAHLILGFVKEGANTIANFFAYRGVDLKSLTEILLQGKEPASRPSSVVLSSEVKLLFQSATEMIKTKIEPEHLFALLIESKDSTVIALLDALSPDSSNQTVSYAIQCAADLKSESVEPEHLILGIMRSDSSLAKNVLQILNLKSDDLLRMMKRDQKPGVSASSQPILSDSLKQIFRYSLAEALYTEDIIVEDHQLLLALDRYAKENQYSVAWNFLTNYFVQNKLRDSIMYELSRELQEDFPDLTPDSIESMLPVKNLSDRTCKVLSVAEIKAKESTFNILGTEHILMGLLLEESGLADKVLKSFGISMDSLQTIVGKFIEEGSGTSSEYMHVTNRCKNVFEHAAKIAKSFKWSEIEPEHLLLAFNQESDCSAWKLLENQISEKVTLLIEEQSNLLEEENKQKPIAFEKDHFLLPGNFSQDSIRIVQLAYTEAAHLGSPAVEPEHLLLGLAKETTNPVFDSFRKHNITVSKMRIKLKELKPRGIGNSPRVHIGENLEKIIQTASKESEDLVEPHDLLKLLILSNDETVLGLLRHFGLTDLLAEAFRFSSPTGFFFFLYQSGLSDFFFSPALTVILGAQDLAREMGHKSVCSEHILLAILKMKDDRVTRLFLDRDITFAKVKEETVRVAGTGSDFSTNEISLAPQTVDLVKLTALEAQKTGKNQIEPYHFVFAMVETKDCVAMDILKACGFEDSMNIKRLILLYKDAE